MNIWLNVLNPLLREFFFLFVLRHSLRKAAIIYRLIEAASEKIYLIIPSYFKFEILAGHTYTIVSDMQQRVNA